MCREQRETKEKSFINIAPIGWRLVHSQVGCIQSAGAKARFKKNKTLRHLLSSSGLNLQFSPRRTPTKDVVSARWHTRLCSGLSTPLFSGRIRVLASAFFGVGDRRVGSLRRLNKEPIHALVSIFARWLFKVGLCSFLRRNNTCACEATQGGSPSLSRLQGDTGDKSPARRWEITRVCTRPCLSLQRAPKGFVCNVFCLQCARIA